MQSDAIMDEIACLVDEIGEGEERISGGAGAKNLLSLFKRLNALEGGSVQYLSTTTAKAIESLYKIDVRPQFAKFEYESIPLTNNNPDSHPWMPSDIKLLVIKPTRQNEELAKLVVRKIIRALEEKLPEN